MISTSGKHNHELLVEFRDVSLSIKDSHSIINRLSLDVGRGETVAQLDSLMFRRAQTIVVCE